MSDTGEHAEVLDRTAAEGILFREARLLDERRFHEWLQMFTDDALYWVPIENEGAPGEPSLIRDNRAGMEERVFRLVETMAHAQIPPSRTQHDVTNVEVAALEPGARAQVLCNQKVHELRLGDPFQIGLGEPRYFAARSEYTFVWRGSWLIHRKICRLMNREFPIYNLTFIF
ncbi:MAG: aromatic-ring-hydroxylating dioxygenase subunit beta [Carbonactinosporaceae bacterium]